MPGVPDASAPNRIQEPTARRGEAARNRLVQNSADRYWHPQPGACGMGGPIDRPSGIAGADCRPSGNRRRLASTGTAHRRARRCRNSRAKRATGSPLSEPPASRGTCRCRALAPRGRGAGGGWRWDTEPTLCVDPAAAEDAVAVVADDGLAGGYAVTRVVEMDAQTVVREGLGCGRSRLGIVAYLGLAAERA